MQIFFIKRKQGNDACFSCEEQWYRWFVVILVLAFYGVITFRWGKDSHNKMTLSVRSVYLFRICMFFYQIIPFIQLQNDTAIVNLDTPNISFLTSLNSILVGLFNAEIPETNSFHVCLFDSNNNLTRLTSQYFVPIICISMVATFAMLNKLLRGDYFQCIESIAPLFLLKWVYYHSTAIVKSSLFIYAQIIRTSFELVSCREYKGRNSSDSESIMYYAGNIDCFQGWHALPIILIIVCLFIPALITYGLYKLHTTDQSVLRESKSRVSQILGRENGVASWIRILKLPYKDEMYWWEGYRMFRIFILSLLVSLSIDELNRLVWIRVFLIYFIVIHLYVQPFDETLFQHEIYININHLETLCLYILFILTLLADYYGKTTDHHFAVASHSSFQHHYFVHHFLDHFLIH